MWKHDLMAEFNNLVEQVDLVGVNDKALKSGN